MPLELRPASTAQMHWILGVGDTSRQSISFALLRIIANNHGPTYRTPAWRSVPGKATRHGDDLTTSYSYHHLLNNTYEYAQHRPIRKASRKDGQQRKSKSNRPPTGQSHQQSFHRPLLGNRRSRLRRALIVLLFSWGEFSFWNMAYRVDVNCMVRYIPTARVPLSEIIEIFGV